MGPSGGAATILEKGKTLIIPGDEFEDVEILNFPKGRQPIAEPPVGESTNGEAPFKIALGDWPRPSSQVDSPTINGFLAEPIVTMVISHVEIVPVVTVSTGMTTVVTSAPLVIQLSTLYMLLFLSLTPNPLL